MENNSKSFSILSAAFLGISIGLGTLGSGFFIGKAVYNARMADNFVTVKGIAEREVKTDLAAWEIDYREVGNDLVAGNAQIERDQKIAISFLQKNGFATEEIETRPTKVNDLLANPYNSSSTPQKYRYIVTGGVRVRSTNVDLIQKVSQMSSELIKQGIPLSFDSGDYNTNLSPNPSYYYTQLDKIRPAMLAEATQSARTVAEQFAKDSNSVLGGIRRASQGIFQMTSRDASSDGSQGNINPASSVNKKVRLVTTIDYFLKSGR